MYIAWADGLLTPTQIEEIGMHIKEQRWLTGEERRRLGGWLDPQNPPDATTYYGWVQRIKESARKIPHAAQKSLAELGIEMASLATVAGPTEEAKRALAEIEDALGIVGCEAVRELVGERPRPRGHEDKASDEAVMQVDVGELKKAVLIGTVREFRNAHGASLSRKYLEMLREDGSDSDCGQGPCM